MKSHHFGLVHSAVNGVVISVTNLRTVSVGT